MGPVCSKVSVTPLTTLNNPTPRSIACDAGQVTNVPTPLVTSNDATYTTNEYVSSNDLRSHISGHFILIWLDLNMHSSNYNDNTRSYITRLQTIINSIKIFHSLDECIDFITDLVNEKVFLVISGRITQQFVSILHELNELDSIYMFSNQISHYRQWTQQYKKVKKVSDQIEVICNALQHNIRQLNYNLTPVSIISSSTAINPNELDQSFMYSQLLKEIILDMPYMNDAKTELISFARSHYAGNNAQIGLIDEFEQQYDPSRVIWWYTRDCFLNWMLNEALRTQNIDMIMKMGFFLRDLHDQIQHLYVTPSNDNYEIVFRGQGVTQEEFDKMKRSKGGLLSFNSFLSTSFDSEVGYLYADSARQNPEFIGILFCMRIDRTVSSTYFASVKDFGYFTDAESEILFSMHTVFRIAEMTKIQDRLWQVNLTLTSDNDPQLVRLMECIRETITGNTPIHRLGNLMWYMGQHDKAEVIYERLLNTVTNNSLKEMLIMNSRLIDINIVKKDHQKACLHRENARNILQELCSSSIYDVVSPLFTKTDSMDHSQEKLSEALLKLAENEQKTLPSHYLQMAAIYCSSGTSLQETGEYSRALLFYQKALKVVEESLPCNHPSLAIIYNNIGSTYHSMKEYLKALSYYEKTIQIAQKSLPCDHPEWATFYQNIGQLYATTGNYPLALRYYEKQLKIYQTIRSINVSTVVDVYIKISSVHCNMEAFSKAILSLKKGLEIAQTSLSCSDTRLATIHNEIGFMYQSLKQYSTSLSYYEKTFEITEKLCPLNQTALAAFCSNIAMIYQLMEQYSTSVLYYEKALEIMHKILPPDYVALTKIYNNIATTYHSLKQYTRALSYYEKTVEICQKNLSFDHSMLFATYNSIGLLHVITGKYSIAQSYLQNGLEAAQKSLPPTHSNLAMIYITHGGVYMLMGQYSTALSYSEKALEICQNARSSNYPLLQEIYMTIGLLYQIMGEYSKARSYFKETIEMQHLSISSNHPSTRTQFHDVLVKMQPLMSSSWLQAWLCKILIRMTISTKKITNTLSTVIRSRAYCSPSRINIKESAPIAIPLHRRQ